MKTSTTDKIALTIFAVAGIALTALVGYALVTTLIWMQHN